MVAEKPSRLRKRKKPPKGTRPRWAAPECLIGSLPDAGSSVNLSGDYGYLTSGYYQSLDLETGGKVCHPTCKEALDAYVAPLFLEKAKLAGLPVPSYYVTNEYFDPPVVVDTLNPFKERESVVLKEAHRDRVTASMTRNYTYAICCQELLPGSRVRKFRAILGWSRSRRYRHLAEAVWRVFHIPLAVVRVIDLPSSKVLLSGLGPLPFRSLTRAELGRVNKVVQWPT